MDKIFVGVVRMVDTGYGQIVKLSVNEADIQKMQGRIESTPDGWCNIEIKKRKHPEGKKTHYAEISTYEPKAKSKPRQEEPEQKETEESESSKPIDDPPF